MKLNKAIKILTFTVLMFTLVMTITNVFAVITPENVTATNTNADTKIMNYGGKILSAVTTAGVVISVIVIAVLGVKYMLGSAEEKSEYKKTLLPYLIGAALVFGASTIATIVYQFSQQ